MQMGGVAVMLDSFGVLSNGSAAAFHANFPAPDKGRAPRLHIALIAPPYFEIPPCSYGGTEAVVADLADALVAAGHTVTLLAAGRPGTAADFIPLWAEPIPERLGQILPEVAHTLKARRAIAELVDLPEGGGVDLIHDHTLAGPMNAAAYRDLGLPTVSTAHNFIDPNLHDFYRELGDDVGLIAISDRQRRLSRDLNWVGCVHNAIRPADWPFRDNKDDYALFLARFNPGKGPHLALQAAHAAGVPLVLAGRCQEPVEIAAFRDSVLPALSRNDYVFGQADARSKRELLAGARCLLLPLQWEEPFGMVMIEAMACGTPVVTLDRGAAREIVVDGVTGFVCADPADLPAAIARARDLDPRACRRHVELNFNSAGMALGYEQIYRRVLSAGTPALNRSSTRPVQVGAESEIAAISA